jgi:hypothetical protein
MGCITSVPQASIMYLDPEGKLRVHNPTDIPPHSSSLQLKHIASLETSKIRGGEEFYLISKAWLAKWIDFTNGNVPKFTSPIDNSVLVDPNDDRKMLASAEFKKDYRLVRKQVWEYYFMMYGASPVIVLKGEECIINDLSLLKLHDRWEFSA